MPFQSSEWQIWKKIKSLLFWSETAVSYKLFSLTNKRVWLTADYKELTSLNFVASQSAVEERISWSELVILYSKMHLRFTWLSGRHRILVFHTSRYVKFRNTQGGVFNSFLSSTYDLRHAKRVYAKRNVLSICCSHTPRRNMRQRSKDLGSLYGLSMNGQNLNVY